MERLNMGLGKRIKAFREADGISQEQLAARLGISRSAISQVENGARRISAEELATFAKTFNVTMDSLVDPTLIPKIDLPKREKAKTVASHDFRISVPQKNLRKFKEVLLYILSRVGSRPNIGETVIYKLLYFIDFDYYELYEEQLIGATYIKNQFGPTPIEFKKIVDRMISENEVEVVKSKYFQFPQRKYLPLRPADLSELKASEIELIDRVLNRFQDWNATRIGDYSHGDVPWLTTQSGNVISYESVFYRTDPYSVRNYGE